MVRSRVKLDLGPHGKVLASVVDFDDAKAVAAGRFNAEPNSVQLYVSDGADLWELHPSAFQDVIAEDRVIVAKVLEVSLLPSSSAGPSDASHVASASTSSTTVAKTDSLRSGEASSSTSLEQQTSTISSNPPSFTQRMLRSRASSIASSCSTSSTHSSSFSSSSSSSSSAAAPGAASDSSSSSSSSIQDRRSQSVQDVTATSATVRTVIGPNGLPVSSKERWDPKTHRLMFEKLNEIISKETIYYTRKYTEERFRIFQLLIDNYGDMGIRGNFLRGRTAQALIARVSGVLRTARDRGEKVKQPFKFFFPHRKDDDLASRSTTAPVTPAATASTSNSRALARSNGGGTRAQTLPVQGTRPSRVQARGNPIAPAVDSATAEGSASTSTQRNGNKGKGKGKGKGKQAGNKPAASVPANPPEIRRRTANAAAIPHASSSLSRPGKRPPNGNPAAASPQSKKQKSPLTPASVKGLRQTAVSVGSNVGLSGQDSARYSGSASSSHCRDRSASPRPRNAHRSEGNQGSAQRSGGSRRRSPYRGRDTWIRARDAATHDGPAADRWEENDRTLRPLLDSVPRRQSLMVQGGQHGIIDEPQAAASSQTHSRGGRSPSRANTLFRAGTGSPPSLERPSPVHRGNRWRRNASSGVQLTSPEGSPRIRRNAVERALDHLVDPNAGTTRPSQPLLSHKGAGRGSGHREWGK